MYEFKRESIDWFGYHKINDSYILAISMPSYILN